MSTCLLRLLILEWHEMWLKITTSLQGPRYLWSGHLLRLMVYYCLISTNDTSSTQALYFHNYSVQSDVWSFGCVLYEIWSIGHKPFENINTTQVVCYLVNLLSLSVILQYLERIMDGYRLPPPPGCPREIYHIMIQCWLATLHQWWIVNE